MTKIIVKPRLVKVGGGAPAHTPPPVPAASPVPVAVPAPVAAAPKPAVELKLEKDKKAPIPLKQKGRDAQPAQAATLPKRDADPARPPLTLKGIGSVALFAILLFGAGLRLFGYQHVPNSKLAGPTTDAMLMNPQAPEAVSEKQNWTNPTLSTIEKYLCRGLSNSRWCSGRPLHPFVEVFGSDRAQMWLRSPDPKENRTITEEIEYENKAFALQ